MSADLLVRREPRGRHAGRVASEIFPVRSGPSRPRLRFQNEWSALRTLPRSVGAVASESRVARGAHRQAQASESTEERGRALDEDVRAQNHSSSRSQRARRESCMRASRSGGPPPLRRALQAEAALAQARGRLLHARQDGSQRLVRVRICDVPGARRCISAEQANLQLDLAEARQAPRRGGEPTEQRRILRRSRGEAVDALVLEHLLEERRRLRADRPGNRRAAGDGGTACSKSSCDAARRLSASMGSTRWRRVHVQGTQARPSPSLLLEGSASRRRRRRQASPMRGATGRARTGW